MTNNCYGIFIMEYVINSNHKPDYSLQSVLFNHQDRLFDCHSKLLLLRVDFAYRKTLIHTRMVIFINWWLR